MKKFMCIIEHSKKAKSHIAIEANNKFHVMELLTTELKQYQEESLKNALSITIRNSMKKDAIP